MRKATVKKLLCLLLCGIMVFAMSACDNGSADDGVYNIGIVQLMEHAINQCEALYIINSAGIAYHQNEVLYIIIAKRNAACG